MLRLVLAFAMALGLAAPAFAQSREETLADIRQQLTVLYVEMQKLRREMSTTGAPSTGLQGNTALDRLASAEAELQRLVARTEELENRIDRVVRDGTNRIGDLEFRLVELEGGDLSQLGETTTLGGGEMPGATGGAIGGGSAPIQPSGNGGSMAVGEQADFDRAMAAYNNGDHAGAAGLFQSFTQTYTAGPLNGEAHYWRGEALARSGNTTDAARAFLTAFSGAPQGKMAARSLFRLGQSLGDLGQRQEACVTLGEVGARYPGAPEVAEAEAARRALSCQ